MIRWTLLVLAVSCTCRPSSTISADDDVPVSKELNPMKELKLEWRPEAIDRLGIEIALLAGARLHEGERDGRYYVAQSVYPVFLGVWEGATITELKTLYASPRGEIVREAAVFACGRPGVRIEATSEPQKPAVGLFEEPDGTPSRRYSDEVPAKTHVSLAVPLESRAVLVRWSVPTGEREAYRADEEHFFRSLRCL